MDLPEGLEVQASHLTTIVADEGPSYWKLKKKKTQCQNAFSKAAPNPRPPPKWNSPFFCQTPNQPQLNNNLT